jgi:hypothetical protein
VSAPLLRADDLEVERFTVESGPAADEAAAPAAAGEVVLTLWPPTAAWMRRLQLQQSLSRVGPPRRT